MSLFGTPQPQQTPSFFRPQTQQHQQSLFQQTPSLFNPQQHQQQQQLSLISNDKVPATYSTKWSDLHPDSQKLLLQIKFHCANTIWLICCFWVRKFGYFEVLRFVFLHETIRERILEYRDESQRLDQCGRLYDASLLNDGFEIEDGFYDATQK